MTLSTFKYMLLLLTLLFAKIFAFYFTVPNAFKVSVVLSTIAWILLFFLIFTFIFKEWQFGLYCVLSIALFADFLYFQNFGTLPSVRHLILLPQVGKLGANIKYFTSFLSLLFIADLIPLGIIDRKRYLSIRDSMPQTPKGLLLTVFLCALFAVAPLVSEKLKPSQVFNRYGFLAYHIYDLTTAFTKPKEQSPTVVKENTQQPLKRKFWAIASKKNVIVIQLESFQNFLIGMTYNGQEITPNLNSLLRRDSIYFSNYYQQTGAGNTADAEFVSLVSLHVPGEEVAYEKYDTIELYALPKILKDHGFHTIAMHGNTGWFWNRSKIYPNIGFEEFVSLEKFKQDLVFGMGLSDLSFFEQAAEILKGYQEPFFSFLVTISSHTPFTLPQQLKSFEVLPEHENTIVGNYLQAIHYADYALGRFIEKLKENGLYDRSIIALYGDHAGLYPFNRDVKEIMPQLLKKDYTYRDAMNIPFVIHIPGSGIKETVKTIGGQIDFLPTLLNLIGIDDQRFTSFGRDLLNTKEGFVAFRYHLPDGSFIDDERYFEVSKDGILQSSIAIDLKTGLSLPYYECLDGYKRAIQQIESSKHILNSYIQAVATVE
ncbi:LTA synthase family protein [Pseudothermotoga sp. U03pept]|uniref:LTA synthase family protein n=1 Tax=Pseudothermotoga sp. U03pept TaxID=3447012 RepID=UPI003F01C226